jgi:hypothetical protein
MRSLTPSDIIRLRLANQRLTRTTFRTAADVVSWFGAVQGQEYPAASWALALRAKGLTLADVDQAFDEGAILRTHVMRPTWHFVTPADIRWLLALTGPRVQRMMASYHPKYGLDARVLGRAREVMARALAGGTSLTRAEVSAVLTRARIAHDRMALMFILLDAELDLLICSGPRRGREFTYMLVEDRVPPAPVVTRDEALTELARRYFAAHGPATLKDFVWWSGLRTGDARAGIAALGQRLATAVVDGLTYWWRPAASVPPAAKGVLLLPVYDEYVIGYKERGLIMVAGDHVFANSLFVDGRLVGSWRRAPRAVTLQLAARRLLTRAEDRLVQREVKRQSTFAGVSITIAP